MRLDLHGLHIAPLTADDVEAFVAYRRLPEVARYQSWTVDFTLADGQRLVEDQALHEFPEPSEWMQFGIHKEGQLAGDLAIHRLADQPDTYEFGITLDPAHHGAGIATRALTAALDHLFTVHHAHRVLATCDERNDLVKRLFGRLGLRFEGTAREADWFKDEWTSVETWELLASER
jgi:RimJ/RimL family protein N-acetyltransferase